ncbi:MAG: twin-arginine translocation signal domain-containing protein, partial [Omnitrophica WOR_2 bacterium]
MKSCLFHQHPPLHDAHPSLSRRDFLKSLGVAAVAIAAAGCQSKAGATPGAVEAGKKSVVAITKANSYDPKLVRKQVQELLDGIGGLKDILAHGNRVAIKVNMTGGVTSGALPGVSEIESFITHPEVVHALGELLIDSGVKDLFIVEAAYEPESWTHYGYADMVRSINAKIVDLTYADPYKDFVDTSPGANPNIYDKFKFNPVLTEIDA